VRILGLDTATAATVAAVCDTAAGSVSERRDDPPAGARPRHGSRLLELAIGSLGDAACSWDELDRIAVGVGPGTFTGLRIGIASARALADARGIPLFGVSTLRSLALCAGPAAREADAGAVAGVIDARRGELFAAAWPLAAGEDHAVMPIVAPAAWEPNALARALRELDVRILAVGDGAIPSRQLLEQCGAVVPPDTSAHHRVSAIGHCRLASAMPQDAAGDVAPAYLRLPDAEITRRRTLP
jgi:tRNA threonylcarbamoyladenosine biosynthesis protein TsaB